MKLSNIIEDVTLDLIHKHAEKIFTDATKIDVAITPSNKFIGITIYGICPSNKQIQSIKIPGFRFVRIIKNSQHSSTIQLRSTTLIPYELKLHQKIYHLTLKRSVKSIIQRGLRASESKPLFFFPTYDTFEIMIYDFCDEKMGQYTGIPHPCMTNASSLLEITTTPEMQFYYDNETYDAGYGAESICTNQSIAPDHITIYIDDVHQHLETMNS